MTTPTMIHYRGSSYEVRPDETILEALVRAGVDAAFSCKKGSCHTCMLRAVSGQPPERGQRGLEVALAESGHFLPCVTVPTQELHLDEPDRSVMFIEAMVAQKLQSSPRVIRLSLEPARQIDWKPGQYVNLRRPGDQLIRSYSIASIAEQDYFMELHIGRAKDGQMSGYLHDVLSEGDLVEVQGPFGRCTYDAERLEGKPMLMLAAGTGAAPIYGVLKDAIRHSHAGPITVIHAVSSPEEAYLRQELEALAASNPNISFTQLDDARDAVSDCFDARPDLSGHALFVCGNPGFVTAARVRAIEAGITRQDTFADPFEDAHPYWPQDKEKMEAWPTEPELWEALEQGTLMRTILTDFYDQVFEDPILSPFFHNVTKERAISKQFEFLYDIFSGQVEFFGLKPFNAHHWMVISDEMFDYREDLFEATVRRYPIEERLVRRWMAFQELFRPEIVKSQQRGMIISGKEIHHEGFSEEVLMMDMVCDACGQEMLEGSTGRMHRRTGQLFCERCGQRHSA